MSLFQSRPKATNPVNYVTVGLNKTILLVGLGNPGREYDQTRHNIGFACIDAFVASTEDMGGWIDKKDMKCQVSTGRLGDARVLAIKPTTYMNLSGSAVQAIAQFYKIPLSQILLVHDELDIDFGFVRLRRGGGSAGHNGIKSVTEHLGDDYGRVRIGIGPKTPEQMDSADFVLQKFSTDEQSHMPELLREVNAILIEFIYGTGLPTETRGFLI